MNKTMIAAALAAVCAMAGVAHAAGPNAGDWVLGRWKGEGYWFPGVVQSVSGGATTIQYDDGTVETLPAHLVKPYYWRAGSVVECRWKGGATWYRGSIMSIGSDGVSLSVKYEDGDSEITKTGACRSR